MAAITNPDRDTNNVGNRSTNPVSRNSVKTDMNLTKEGKNTHAATARKNGNGFSSFTRNAIIRKIRNPSE